MAGTKKLIITPTFKLKKLLKDMVGSEPGFNLVWQMAVDYMVKCILSGARKETLPEFMQEAYGELDGSTSYYFADLLGFKLVESSYRKDSFTFSLALSGESKNVPDLSNVTKISRTPYDNGWMNGVVWFRPVHCAFYYVKATRNPLADFVQESAYLVGKHHKVNIYQKVFDAGDDKRIKGIYFEVADRKESEDVGSQMSNYVRNNRGIYEEGERRVGELLPDRKDQPNTQHQGNGKKPDFGIGRNQVCVKGKEYRNVVSYHKETRLPMPQIYRRLNSRHPEWIDWFFIGSPKDTRRKSV
ncbi:hypothetical protein [Serratia phage BUCT660]|nr:hypothetical protein [Serratia phage BUCT660]